MSAYLQFFELEKSPFDTRAQSNLVLGTKALRTAFSQIEQGLQQGAPRICLSGEAGMGKTSLARALPKLLGECARVVLILNPALPWPTLRGSFIKQLGLADGVLSRKTLMATTEGGRRLVLAIDQAEQISQEVLEHLDILLNYRSDDDEQLVHCVLLANLERARQLDDCPLLWWLDSLTTLQLEYAPIPASGVESYINKHLRRAGWKGGCLFTPEAAVAIHRLTGGIPRLVSELCERGLAEAAERSVKQIGPELVEELCGEVPEDRVGDSEGPSEAEPEASPAAAESAVQATPPAATVPSASTRSEVPQESPAEAKPVTPRPETPAQSESPSGSFAPLAAPPSLDSMFGHGDTRDAQTERDPLPSEDAPRPSRRAGRWLAAAVVVAALIGGGLYAVQGGPLDELLGAGKPAPAAINRPKPQGSESRTPPPTLAHEKGPAELPIGRAGPAPSSTASEQAPAAPTSRHAKAEAAGKNASPESHATASPTPKVVEKSPEPPPAPTRIAQPEPAASADRTSAPAAPAPSHDDFADPTELMGEERYW